VFTKKIDKKTQQSFIIDSDDHDSTYICFDKETVLQKLQRLQPDKIPTQGPDAHRSMHKVIVLRCHTKFN